LEGTRLLGLTGFADVDQSETTFDFSDKILTLSLLRALGGLPQGDRADRIIDGLRKAGLSD
jgi:hypothetical protein